MMGDTGGRQRTREEHNDRVLLVSRIVWDNVVQWLLPSSRRSWSTPPPDLTREHCVTLARVGEGVFPLVPRVCRLILSRTHKYYTALGAAAEAGASSCLCWLLKSHNSNNNTERSNFSTEEVKEKRELMCVLDGLCCGGHSEMAQALVDYHHGGGILPGITWRKQERSDPERRTPGFWYSGRSSGSGGGESDPGTRVERRGVDWDLAYHVKSSNLLERVCDKGHMGVARWLVERFDIRDEPWELIWALVGAVRGGHLELAKWAASQSVHVIPLLIRHEGLVDYEACQSGNLGVVKWCFENFPLGRDTTCFKLIPCIGDSERKGETVEVCQFVKDHSPAPSDWPTSSEEEFFGKIGSLDVLKWATSAFPEFTLSKENLEHLCEVASSAHEMAKWVVEEKEIHPNLSAFCAACRNSEDDVQLVQWLASKVAPSGEILQDSLVSSLERSNTAVASWLDDTFHIVEKCGAVSILMNVCKKMFFGERLEGVAWILNHPMLVSIDETTIVKAVRHLVFKKNLSATPLLIIEKFPIISEPTRTELLIGVLKESVQGGDLTQVKKVISMCEFTKEAVAQCLAIPDCPYLFSSKSVKWLITQFQLERKCITLNNIAILKNLLVNDHASCAEWVINRFHITLDEVIGFQLDGMPLEFDMFTWQMMLRVFPSITAAIVKEHFLKLVTSTPAMAQFTMQMFPGITTTDIAERWSHEPEGEVPLSVQLWINSIRQ
ncbi:hypothetical protein Pelo_4852 [Pelomyxa schiedti]|nr:hypothetical protein Pelo_4852 [Pelomyxa schiedti]